MSESSNETPASPPKPLEKFGSGAQQALQIVEAVDQATKGRTPLVTIAAIVIPLLFGGGGISFGWSASSEAKAQSAAVLQRLDKIEEALAARDKADAAAVARAQAERHEERIRTLEDKAREHERVTDKLLIEVDALKKAGPK